MMAAAVLTSIRSGATSRFSQRRRSRFRAIWRARSSADAPSERWVPVHGTVPFSKAAQMWERCEAVFAKHAAAVEKFDIDHGYLSCTVGQVGTLLEPVMYWPDARNAFHERVLDAGYLTKLPKYPPNPEAAAAVARIREELATTFMESGAVSFQLGKFYPYLEGLEPTAAHLLKQLKQMFDPQGRMNPGALRL